MPGDEQAKEFAPPFKEMLPRLAQARDGQRVAWHEEVSAQAAVCTGWPARVRGWTDSLASEPEKELDDMGAILLGPEA